MKKLKVLTFHYLVLLLAVSGTSSCESDKSIKSDGLIIDYKEFRDVELRNFFKDITYVILENHEESIINNVGRIVVLDTSILVESGDQLTEFSKQGKFLRRLNEQGFGPSEYQRIADFQLVDNRLAILDNKSDRLLFYNLEDFSFDSYIPLQFRGGSSFEYDNEEFYFHKSNRLNPLLNGIDKYEIITTDKEGNIIGGYLPYEGEVKSGVVENLIGLDRPFGLNGSSLFYSNGFRNDSLYILRNGKLTGVNVEFPSRPSLLNDSNKSHYQSSPEELLSRNSEIHLGPFFNFLTPKSQSFVILHDMNFRWVYLKDNKIEFMSKNIVDSQIKIDIIAPNNYSNGYFVSVLTSEWIETQEQKIINGLNDNEFLKTAHQVLNEDLNPILILYKEK
ncbi:6-bladed beta-propeller [uncultured Roseivirga sp.]|uniref:6-bladed beta-propeller n=1 Tax=uncultured Roseivirga sp. TaxID=543088 RepID=UPI0030D89AD2|tara:strand:+ start:5673 stop:6845 length:1173 start_codon:yes stop_codon:yes gene_type:complete